MAAFFMYMGLPEAARAGHVPVPDRSKSVMGTVDTQPGAMRGSRLRATPAGRLAPPGSPLRLAPRAPKPQLDTVGLPVGPPQARGQADDASNAAFAKLAQFKEMLDVGLITQNDYDQHKHVVLSSLLGDPSEAMAGIGIGSPTTSPAPSFSSPALPGISDHKSPSPARRKKKLARSRSRQDEDIPKIRGLSVEQAVRLIQSKIQSRLEGGPDGLQRAFRYRAAC